MQTKRKRLTLGGWLSGRELNFVVGGFGFVPPIAGILLDRKMCWGGLRG